MLWEENIGGAHWSGVLRRGMVLRLTAADDANVAALFYSREQPLERYNMADTLKAQHTAHLTAGCVCYSDMGRMLCSIIADTCGWHDPLCGLTDADADRRALRRDALPGAAQCTLRERPRGMLVELGKYGLGERDLVANVNFFSKVVVDDSGSMRLQSPGTRGPGSTWNCVSRWTRSCCCTPVRIRWTQSTLYAPLSIRLSAYRAAPPAADDPCRTRCPENARGFINTERLYL